MAAGPRLGLSGQQRLRLNPGLNQSVELLRLDAAALTAFLEQEAAENPWLQIEAPVPPAPQEWLPRWQVATTGQAPEAPNAGPSLIAHVVEQVAGLTLSPAQADLALILIEALEPSGWITEPLPRIARTAGVAVAEVESVLALLQRIEPCGLFARDLAECLRLQAMDAGELDAVMAGLLDNLALLANGQTAKLAHLLGTRADDIRDRLRLLRGYNPKPGTLFDPLTPAHSREPDLILHLLPGPNPGWQITVNRATLPGLRLALNAPGGEQAEGTLARARAVVAMVKARNQTLLRVAEAILGHQYRAILGGAGDLVPLTMAEIGEELDLHESTISRAVAGTSMDSPRGVIWLRRLFSPEVARTSDGRAVSKAALKARLVQLIAREDRQSPLRDVNLAESLAQSTGILLSRRTIAAYREEAGIPIAGRRAMAKMRLLAAKRPERSHPGLSRGGV